MNKIPYFKIESFGAVDGPGVRLVIFLQGCTYRCVYCHNPESWALKTNGQKFITSSEIINLYKKNSKFYENGGGITISGGEPMLHLEFILELAKQTKMEKIHLAIDTSATNYQDDTKEMYLEIAKYVDLWIIDIKHINPNKHKSICGVAEQREINLINDLDKVNTKMLIRQVLIPSLTDDSNDLYSLGVFLAKLKNLTQFELLPYHKMALGKYKELGIDYTIKDILPPTQEQLSQAVAQVRSGINSVKSNSKKNN